MTQLHVVKIRHEDGEISADGAYTTVEKARQALVDWVEDSPISPVGAQLSGDGDVCTEDWYLEPTAFGIATDQLRGNGFSWSICQRSLDEFDFEVDGSLE